MASIIAGLRNWPERLFLALFALMWAACLQAAGVEVGDPRISAHEEGYALSADFALEFNRRLEEAVDKGVVLQFVVEFELTRSRWYWFDEKVLSRSRSYRLSYHALTRQYRLSSGALPQSFETLPEALHVLSRLRNWAVIDKADKLRPGESYQAALRLRLDISQLPRPFQIAALGNRDWDLSSDWKLWQITLPAPAPPAAPPPAAEAK